MRTIFALLIALLAAPVSAETRVAFMVGNAAYQNAPALANPTRDIGLMARTLQDLDFTVEAHENLSRDGLTDALGDFLTANTDADVTLFYFAGHGLQYQGQNYLVGVDALLQNELDIDSETVSLDRIVQLLERSSKAALVFVDACRDNPLATRFYTEALSDTRAVGSQGLAPVDTAYDGAMLMFSASPGQVARDGVGQNSAFSLALAKHLPTPGAEILTVMKRVIADVKSETAGAQVPMVSNNLTTEIVLKAGSGGDAGAIADAQEQALFEAAMEIGTARGWEVFLQRFPDGRFAEAARAEFDRLTLGATETVTTSAPQADTPPSPSQMAELERGLGMGTAEAIAIQAALNRLGYDAGPEDGNLGRKSRRAIADYQLAMGLEGNGVVNAATAKMLGVAMQTTETSILPVATSGNARRYDPDVLALIETDERLIKAAKALTKYDFVYGYFDGRLYIAVQTWTLMEWPQAVEFAAKVGGHLATLTTEAENDFVYAMVRDDQRFWDKMTLGYGTIGPSFGMMQPEGSREPDGGWGWTTGEPVTFTNWNQGEPGNSNNDEFIGAFQWDTYPERTDRHDTSKGWGDFPTMTKSIILEIE